MGRCVFKIFSTGNGVVLFLEGRQIEDRLHLQSTERGWRVVSFPLSLSRAVYRAHQELSIMARTCSPDTEGRRKQDC